MRRFRFLLRSLVPLCCAWISVNTAVSQRIALRHYTQPEGLSNQVIVCLLQDRVGFIWIGTENGLFRYDGRSFVRFDTTDGLPSGSILSIHQDAHNNLWVGTDGGLCRYTNGHFFLEGPTASSGGYGLGAITSDASGRVYFGCPNGLGIFEPADHSRFKLRMVSLPGHVSAPVHGVLTDLDGAIWFSSDTTLYRMTKGRVEEVGAKANVPKDQWDSITLDQRNAIWIRSSQRLLRKDAGLTTFQLESEHLQHAGDAQHVGTTAEGDVLVPDGPGLLVFAPNKHWAYLDQKQGLPEISISCVLQDREGSVWLGTWGGGLYRWLGFGVWRSWTRAEGLSDSSVWQIVRDARGTLWAGTQNGLNSLSPDEKIWRHMFPGPATGASDIRTMLSQNGGLWLGFARKGAWWFDEHHNARRIPFSPLSPDISVFKLARDREGRIWAATDAGLFRSSSNDASGRFERQPTAASDSHNAFYDVTCDHKGRIWGAGTKGLGYFDNGIWKRLGVKDGLQAADARCVSEDHAGSIWVSYDSDRGLTRITEGDRGLLLQHFNKEHGLKSDDSNFIGCDKYGQIWSGTDNGLDVFNGSRWAHFGTEQGLWWADTDTNGFWADRDGTVWVGTSGGISRFRPLEHSGTPVPPGVAITSVAAGAYHFSAFQSFRLRYGSQPLEISFTGLTFVNGSDVQFRYRLVGLDDKWSDTSNPSVNYSHLPPGNYRFEVFSKNAEGLWSTSPATTDFTVLTPWWMTLWFRMLALLALGMAALLSYRWRVRSINLQNQKLRTSLEERTVLLEKANTSNRLKNEFLANMSHEIRTPMHGLMAMVELTLDSELTDEQRENLLIISQSASSLQSVLNDVLDLSKIEANCMELENTEFGLPGVIDACAATMHGRAKEKGLQLISTLSPDVPGILIGDQTRVRQVLLNLLGNAIKFTEQGEVEIAVRLVASKTHAVELQFSVRDSGIGIPREAHAKIFEAFVQADGSMTRRFGGTGLGLSICCKLVRLMGGDIWLESESGLGSTFYFTAVFDKPVALPVASDAPELVVAGEN